MSKLELFVGLVIGLSLSTIWGTPNWQNGHSSNQLIAESGQTSIYSLDQQDTSETKASYSAKQKVEETLFPTMSRNYLNRHALLQGAMVSCEGTIPGASSVF